jgi:serine/threonine protein kinase
MLDNNHYVKVIDFGEAKIVDNYEKASNQSDVNRRQSILTSSDGQSSFFGRIGTLGNKNKLKRQCTFVGTPMYCAPEMLEHNQAGLFTDLWALGCIMYELSCGKKMFKGKNNQQVFTKILEYEVEFPKSMDKDLVDLI